MWDFEHAPLSASLGARYQIDRMSPSDCAAALASGHADIGLVPIAALATTPRLRILPGCTIASKGRVRSLLLVRRASQPLATLRSVAADVASRTTLAYARLLFHKWGNPAVPFIPAAADLDTMLRRPTPPSSSATPHSWLWKSAKTVSSAPAKNSSTTTSRKSGTRLPAFPSYPPSGPLRRAALLDERVADDFIQSRDHGLENIDALVSEWSARLPIPDQTIRAYLTTNIHYVLDEECIEGMKGFFRMAAELGVLPDYKPPIQ